MRVRTHRDKAIISRASFFTKEHGFHSLAEEPLTLSPRRSQQVSGQRETRGFIVDEPAWGHNYARGVLPDGVRCPLSTAVFPPTFDLALLGWVLREERELVGGCQGRKRGA
jgi:hypothetical protein